MESEWLGSSVKERSLACQNGYLVGLYGWRRRCILFTLGLLLVLVLVNLTLSLWIIKVLRFSLNGPDSLRILPGGIQLHGEAMILDKLVASKLSSRKGQLIQVESSKNISLLARTPDARVNSKLFLGNNKLDVMASSLKISDFLGRLLFSSANKNVVVGAEKLRVSRDTETVFYGSIQTPLVKADAGHALKLESPTRSLFALHGVNTETKVGEINANCLTDFKVQSKIGTVKLDAQNIYLPQFSTAKFDQKSLLSPTSSTSKSRQTPQSSQSTNQHMRKSLVKPQVFQVCICGKGYLTISSSCGRSLRSR